MSSNDIYSAPTADLEHEIDSRAGKGLKAVAVLLSLPICIFSFISQLAKIGIAGAIGGVIGGLIPPLLVVAIFQVFKRFRNSRSRWKIFAWAQAIFLVGVINSVFLAASA